MFKKNVELDNVTKKLKHFPQFTFELSNVGVDSGRAGILATRKLNGSYRW